MIARQTVERLLGDLDWRTRIVGDCFAAICGMNDLFPTVDTMLLQSEVYAGKIYAVALATYKPDLAVALLEKYLKYYLTQPRYNFDQHLCVALGPSAKSGDACQGDSGNRGALEWPR